MTIKKILTLFFAMVVTLFICLLVSHPDISFAGARVHPSQRVRVVKPSIDQVTLIHTAMGYSTILQFPGKPLNAVLGDQDAFKVEFVGNSLTIKPLIFHARSNLFVFTEFEQYNCELQSGQGGEVDYIVNFKSKEKAPDVRDDPSLVRPKAVHRFKNVLGFKLNVVSVATSPQVTPGRSTKVIEFELSSSNYPYSFSASSLGVKQGHSFVPIESLYLDTLTLKPGSSPVRGKIAVLDQDLEGKFPIIVVFAVTDPRRLSKTQKMPKTLRLEVIAEAEKKPTLNAKKGGDLLYGILPTPVQTNRPVLPR